MRILDKFSIKVRWGYNLHHHHHQVYAFKEMLERPNVKVRVVIDDHGMTLFQLADV